MSHTIDIEYVQSERMAVPVRGIGVRITHWTAVFSVFGLIYSGVGILISHPRLYWGETGAVGAPSLVDLPIPFIIGPSVWQRPIHFLFAWILVLAGLTYVVSGILTKHFRNDLLPAYADLNWNRIAGAISGHGRGGQGEWRYNVVQRLTYLSVVFGLFPAILWTGLAMSPALMTVFPWMVTVLGGHQSARTLHFVFVVLLMVFLIVHLTMLYLTGFVRHVQAMITGYAPEKGQSL